MDQTRPASPAEADAPVSGRRRRLLRRLSRAVLLAVVLVIVAGLAGFFRFAAEISALRSADPAAAADGIVVLTGGKARIETALDLLDRGKGRRLLISGVHPLTSAAAIRSVVGGSADLFDCCVDIDHVALDTYGNAAEAGKWAERHGFASLIVVTSDYHMPRSLMEMRRSNPDLRLLPHLVSPQASAETDWASEPGLLRVVAAEYFKYLAAAIRARLESRLQPTAMASAGGS
ncbi:MAG: hypothetical protein BroJett030_13840 [Alphaproteobacteria bacterium]|nr:MAG: hypothetical protein BroJett030_13840 [Alphaproteobacteria bacterium]